MSRLLNWFVTNRVAANLLMAFLIVAGLVAWPNLRKKLNSDVTPNVLSVGVAWPGATPTEVESALCIPIEERIQGLEGVAHVSSLAEAGVCRVFAELGLAPDTPRVRDRIQASVDAIDSFPEDAGKPRVEELKPTEHALTLVLSGPTDIGTLRRLGEALRDEILDLPAVTRVELVGAPAQEVAIEVSERALRRHAIGFDDVAAAVRRSSLDLPGGLLRGAESEILLRTDGRALRGADFADLVLLSREDGTLLRLGDVASVVDGVSEDSIAKRLDGQPAVLIRVLQAEDQDLFRIAEPVHAVVERTRRRLPEGIQLLVWNDYSEHLRERLDLLLDNARSGLVLVLLTLLLFLPFRLAAWVSLGIPVAFLGAIAVLPVFDVTINTMSVFAFLVTLGLVVDDAIVVGESIAARREEEPSPLRAAVDGVREVALPVSLAALTTMVAFLPIFFVPTVVGRTARELPIIVIACLLFSLLECLFVFPAHLAHHGEGGARPRQPGLAALQSASQSALRGFVEHAYLPAIEFTLRWRYAVAAAALAILLLSASLLLGGRVESVYAPHLEGRYVRASLTLPRGSSQQRTEDALRHVEAAAGRLADELARAEDAAVVLHVLGSLGEQPYLRQQNALSPTTWSQFEGHHVAEVELLLSPPDERRIQSAEIAERWQALSGAVPGVMSSSFSSQTLISSSALEIELAGARLDELRRAADDLSLALGRYRGVSDVSDSLAGSQQELRLHLRPEAEAYGVALADLARQLRQGFQGEELQHVQRGRDTVPVLLRYPASERRSLGDLERIFIRTPQGTRLPFTAVAEAELVPGASAIRRAERHRVVTVTAEVDDRKANPSDIVRSLRGDVLPAIAATHPGVSIRVRGQEREQAQTRASLERGLALALLGMYALLCLALGSYVHPLIVLSAVPFGIAGVVLGHGLVGWQLSSFSIIGMVALAGVVVNDSLVLVHAVNGRVAAAEPLRRALVGACSTRFRPVLLTTVTTCAGLTPLLLDPSTQAAWVRPIAAALAFGEIFSTAVILLLVPVLYAILDDLRALPARLSPAATGSGRAAAGEVTQGETCAT